MTLTIKERVLDECKIGGDPEKAKALAILALAEAINDLAAELRGMGTEGQPFHTYELTAP